MRGLMLTSIADWGAIAGVAGALVAFVGLGLLLLQLRAAASASSAQATIQFQAAFRRSGGVRGRLQRELPVHVSVVDIIDPSSRADVATWETRADLCVFEDELRAAIGALNDVAQYVADGLSLQSALQQYHTIFIRLGVLLCPYIDLLNMPEERDGELYFPSRFGRRVPILYNAALDYHRLSPKHRHTTLVLERPSIRTAGRIKIPLIVGTCQHVKPHRGFLDDPPPPLWQLRSDTLGGAIRAAERKLRA